jgi:RNA polymerase sigma-70 factor (ECF subfamily)
MSYKQPLTSEQRKFAEDNNNLVYSFLRFKRLNYEDYYDIIIFGYLRAVRKYLDRPELQQYKFTTIAYAAMNTDLINHYRKQSRLKRRAYVVSLDTYTYGEDSLSLTDIIPADDTTANNITYEQLLEEISAVLPQEQFNMLRMKSEGYNDREIAKEYDVTVKYIRETLSSVKENLSELNLVK